jgi:hypothetical protein
MAPLHRLIEEDGQVGLPRQRAKPCRRRRVERYWSLRFRPPSVRGGLALWQERLVEEMLMADLSGDFSLVDMANACRLSTGHFSRAFKQTMAHIDAAIAEYRRPTASRLLSTLRTKLGAELTIAKIELATTHQRQPEITSRGDMNGNNAKFRCSFGEAGNRSQQIHRALAIFMPTL